jgi:hypothetical protein
MVCVVCGVWCVVCGVWCVVCGVWCVVCGVWCVVCGVWCVVWAFHKSEEELKTEMKTENNRDQCPVIIGHTHQSQVSSSRSNFTSPT